MGFDALPWPQFDGHEEEYVLAAVRSGHWWRNEGSWVARFEAQFAALERADHVIGITNGTHALELALLAADVPRGTPVVLPALTFYSTLSAVQRHGAVPVVADVDEHTWNLPAEAALPGAAAIVVVHYGGVPADLPQLAPAARVAGLALVQDAAHGPGISIQGRSLAEFGGVVCYSFQQSKLLPAGDGGAVALNDEDAYRAALLLHNCGRAPGDTDYTHAEVSSNYRMPEVTGALALAQLEKFSRLSVHRARNAQALRQRLSAVDGLTLQQTPDVDCATSNYLVQARLSYPGANAADRDQLVSRLRRSRVPVTRSYPPLFELPAYWKAPEPGVDLADLRERCRTAVAVGATGISLHHRILLGPAQDMTVLADLIEDTVAAIRDSRQ